MSRFMKAFKKGEKGFTLIELLVVIAILAVIAGVVVLNIGRFIGSGAKEAACTELHNVQTAAIALLYENSTHDPAPYSLPGSVTPGAVGDLANFLLTDVSGSYTIDNVATSDTYGKVTQDSYPGITAAADLCNSTGGGGGGS